MSSGPGSEPPAVPNAVNDWYELFSRGSRDWLRHSEKIREAVREHLPQIVAGLVRDGYQMIFATSFGMLELGVNGQLWKKYPKVLFEQAT